MEKLKPKLLVSGLKFPEGPVFDFEGNLWLVEIQGGNLSKWDGEKLERFDVDGTPNGAMFDKQGNIFFCDSRRGEIRVFDVKCKTFRTICNKTDDGTSLKRPNDLIFDSLGNLLFSDHADGREEPLSTICVLPAGANRAKVISSNKFFTNGLALTKDGQTLIFAETYRQQLWKARWDALKLELREERSFAKTGGEPQGPDGMAFDENENLFVAVFNEGKVNVYSPEGRLVDWIKTEGSRPTSCAFDPSGKLGLVVTEADRGQVLSFPELGKGLPIFYGPNKNEKQ